MLFWLLLLVGMICRLEGLLRLLIPLVLHVLVSLVLLLLFVRTPSRPGSRGEASGLLLLLLRLLLLLLLLLLRSPMLLGTVVLVVIVPVS